MCGESSKLQPRAYIVGGDIVQSSQEWPWMVAIHFSGEFVGAGVHIGNGWIVTAAHLARVSSLKEGSLFTEKYVKFITIHLFVYISLSWLIQANALVMNYAGSHLKILVTDLGTVYYFCVVFAEINYHANK